MPTAIVISLFLYTEDASYVPSLHIRICQKAYSPKVIGVFLVGNMSASWHQDLGNFIIREGADAVFGIAVNDYTLPTDYPALF